MLSKAGVSVTPSKIQDVTKLAPPTTIAEVCSLLGFTNFLRDHVPHYTAIAQPIQDLIPKVQGKKKASILEFWTPLRQRAFDSLKESLLRNTVLRFPDPNQPFILYTDASKHHMAAILLQDNAPIGYFLKAFAKTQCKWTAFTKEAYTVYAAVLFYKVFITGCKVKLMCDHKPLEGFLQATTKNDMVNRWSINIQEYDISFQWVETSKNLSDCLTQLVDPQLFTPLPIEQVDDPDAITVTAIQTTEPALIQLSTDDIRHLQRSNTYCKHIFASFDTDPRTRQQFTTKDSILYHLMQVSGITHLALVVPQSLALTLVRSIHLEFQHPGAARTYDTLATRVYWQHMWVTVCKYVRGCNVCQLHSLKQHTFPSKHDCPPNAPWTRIAIDCIGFTRDISQGHIGVMTGICLATQYPWAEPIHAKSTECIQAAVMNILTTALNVREIVSDNEPEFGKVHFDTFLNKLNIHHQQIAPHHPESNGVLERFHHYLNSVVRNAALVNPTACWLPAVMGALRTYRTLPHTASGESPHFLVTGQDPTYAIDTLLPTLTRDFRNPKRGLVDLAQMQLAFSIT